MFRFDKLVYLGVSKDKESQLKILTALTRKYVQSVVHTSYTHISL